MSDPLDLSAGLLPESPRPRRGQINRDRILQIARSDNIPDDIADDFAKVMNFESGGSHYDRRGKVKLSPPDPKTGERAVGAVQIKPSTSKGVGVDDPFDEDANIKAGLRYFRQGGEDPTGRRIHYFGGPGALKKYQRTGQIPKGKDVLGTTFEKYVQSTGGQQKPKPKIDLSAGLVDNLEAGLEDSGQTQPPTTQKSETRKPAKIPYSTPKATSVPSQQVSIADLRQADDTRRPPPLSMAEMRRQDEQRTQRLQRIKQQVQTEQAAGAEAMQRAPASAQARLYDPRLNVAEETLRRYPDYLQGRSPEELRAAEEAERQRQQRVSQMPVTERLKQVPKSAGLALSETASTGLKSIALLAKKIDFTGVYEGKKASDLATYQAGEYVSRQAREILRSNPDLEQDFLVGKAPQAIGQAVSFLLGGIATKAPKLTVTILGAGLSAGSAYDEVIAAGGTDEEAVNAGLLAGAILGPTELIGMRGAMKAIAGTPLEATLNAALKKALREGRRDVIENALQEAGQELGQGLITGQRRSPGQIAEAAALGALASGVVTPTVTLGSQLGGRRGTQTKVQPPVEAQRAPVESVETQTPTNISGQPETGAVPVLQQSAEPIQPTTTGMGTARSEVPQRFYHKQFGEVEVLPDQTGAGKNKYRVAEVADPTKQHFVKKAHLTGRGNERMVPLRPEPAVEAEQAAVPAQVESAIRSEHEAPNLEAGLLEEGVARDATRAYHGSRHEFEDFTLQKLGAGEGNQAYGWGLYFTDNKKVAEFYKGAGKTNRWTWPPDKAPLNYEEFDPTEQYLIEWLDHPVNRHISNRAEAIAGLEAEAQQADRQAWKPEIDRAIQYLKDHPRLDVAEGGGKIYEVELAPKSDEWLDWDKPLSEQSPRVQKALKSAGVFSSDKPANEFYSDLQAKAAGGRTAAGQKMYPEPNPRKASKFLRSIGVRGIRYYTGESHHRAGPKEHNYVLFDDRDVRMARRPSVSEPANKISAETTAARLPELRQGENFRKPLKEYGDTFYRETSPAKALESLPTSRISTDLTADRIYLSNTPDLALGQGSNKGVMLEFESADLQGAVNTSKPTWKPLYDQGQAEFVAQYNKQGQYQRALKSVTIKPDAKMSRVERKQLDRALVDMEQQGWVKSKQPDGSTVYSRPSPVATKPKPSPETTAAGFKTDLSLSQFVRKMGGIVPGEMYRGELDRIRMRETGTTGLINQKAKQGNVKQTADIMMQAANDAGYRDPKTGRPFENPGDFLYAIERDVLGDKIRVQTGDEVDWDARYREHWATEAGDYGRADATVRFLESGRGAELFDRIAEGRGTDADRTELSRLATEQGADAADVDRLIREAELERETPATLSSALPGEGARSPQQLGFVQEGLTQETAPPRKPPDQRGRLVREEQQRQTELNPQRSAALAKLAEIRRRGMTVDDYVRQPDLLGTAPSAEEVANLREIEAGETPAVPGEPGLSFGPGTMRAGEPLPDVKERKFGKRFTEDERIAEEIRETIGTAKYYEPIPEKVTAANARDLISKRGIAESLQIIKDEKNDIPFHVRNVMSQIVIQRLNQAYKTLKDSSPKDAELVLNQANEMAEHLMEFGTRLGQGVQAFAQWARQTPEGILLTYRKIVREARDRQKKLFDKDVAEITKTLNREGMSDEERVQALKDLFGTNKTAKKVKSELGKILEAAKSGKLTDTLFYEIVGDKLGLPNYNKETAAKITDLALRIESAAEGLPKDKLLRELATLIASEKGFDAGDLPMGIFYTHILSGYNTHAVNLADTGLNVFAEINNLAISEPRAAAKIYAGVLRGLNEGKFDALLALTKGRMFHDAKWLEAGGLMEASKFGQKGGVPIKTDTRFGRLAKRAAESKIAIPLNAYKYVGRAMSAADAVNARAALEAKANLLAYKIAKAEGLKGADFENRVQEILALGRDAEFLKIAESEGFTGAELGFRARELRDLMRDKDLMADAAEFAGEATYNHKPHGTLGFFAQQMQTASNKFKPLKLFVPFTQIVANVTNRGLNWTPYGYKRALAGWGYGPIHETVSAEERRAMLTRATAGTVGLVLLGVMQEAGLMAIHGNGPNDREKRRQMMNAGWKPYSLQIGDTYISYIYSPVGLGLSIMGNWKDSSRYHELQSRDAATRAAYTVTRVGSTVFSQSFLSGLTRLFDALSDDSYKSISGVRRSLSGTAAAFTTPNIARDIYRLFDPKVYQANTLMEDLVKNTPLAVALGLKPTLNAFGEPVKVQRQRFFDIQSSEPAWKFVIEKQLRVPVPGRTIEMEKGRRITPEEYYDLLKITGPKVKDWIIKNRARLSRMKEQDAQDELSEAATRIRKFELIKMKMKVRKKAA